MNQLNSDTGPSQSDVSLDQATLPKSPTTREQSVKQENQKLLFSEEEVAAWEKRFTDLKTEYDTKKSGYDRYSAAKEALEASLKAETNSRILGRAEELLDGFLYIIGTRGRYFQFHSLFAYSDNSERIAKLETTNTPENRRALHTLFKAFLEIPKSWGCSAFIRFLRNQGKQKDPKFAYSGKGMFSKDYGWTGDQVKRACEFLMGYWHGRNARFGSYPSVVNTYFDVQDEIYKDDPDFETEGAYKASFAGTRTARNEPLLQKMMSILEERGLGPIPTPKQRGPRKARKPKQFKSGDIIRKGNLRDLPLPALVRVEIERQPHSASWSDKKAWKPASVEWVVARLTNGGSFVCFFAGRKTDDPKNRDAFISSSFWGQEKKDYLYGAEYLGPWEGKLHKDKEAKSKFRMRVKGSEY